MSTPQLPLSLRFGPDQRLHGYRDAPAGLRASLLAMAAGDARDSLFLSGATGSGKSHLLLAACAEASDANRAVAYLPLKVFGARAADALVHQGAVQLACVDDVQSIAGDREAEVALFDLHNRVHDGGGVLLYAADATSLQLALALPDLRSRLAQCTQFALAVPDETQRRAILRTRRRARSGDRRCGDGLLVPSCRTRPWDFDSAARSTGSRIAGGAAADHGAVLAAGA